MPQRYRKIFTPIQIFSLIISYDSKKEVAIESYNSTERETFSYTLLAFYGTLNVSPLV